MSATDGQHRSEERRPTFGELVAKTEELLAPSLAFDEPNVPVERAEGCYFFTPDGRRYLDFVSGMASCNTGHRHPKVVAAAKAQLDKLINGPIGVVNYEPLLRLAEELGQITPGELKAFFLGNSGTEATEGALKLARYVTGRPGIVAFLGGFHGRTYGAASVTTSKGKYRHHYEPYLSSVYFAPYAYCYRCPKGSTPQRCGLACLEEIQTLFDRVISPREVACFILEPIQGEGGYVVPPQEWLRELREICTRHGIMLIFDEIQTGFGRTGEWFAAQTFGVTPDIMAVAKSIASGFPLSAVVASPEVMSRWSAGAHGTTFGGNPVSCAAALATIEVFREENLLERSRKLGSYALSRLQKLKEKASQVGDVRGKGLMIGIEFIRPETDKEPNPQEVKEVLQGCLNEGLILYPCGFRDQAIRFIPPLVVSEEELEEGLSIFEKVVLRGQ
jgi:4-aminobutyrate aminotransferase